MMAEQLQQIKDLHSNFKLLNEMSNEVEVILDSNKLSLKTGINLGKKILGMRKIINKAEQIYKRDTDNELAKIGYAITVDTFNNLSKCITLYLKSFDNSNITQYKSIAKDSSKHWDDFYEKCEKKFKNKNKVNA